MAQISHCFAKRSISYNLTMLHLSTNQRVLQHLALVSDVASLASCTWRLCVSDLSANQISPLSLLRQTWFTQSRPVITSFLQLLILLNIQMARSRRLKSRSFAPPCSHHLSSSEQSWSSAKSAVESCSAWIISLKIVSRFVTPCHLPKSSLTSLINSRAALVAMHHSITSQSVKPKVTS